MIKFELDRKNYNFKKSEFFPVLSKFKEANVHNKSIKYSLDIWK